MPKAALGKGLGALINASAAAHPEPQPGEAVHELPIEAIHPAPLQPRRHFEEESLAELVESIREHGVIQPLIVRKINDYYELIAGERRWRAARKIGLDKTPALIRDASDLEVLELALIENLQREDLNPIEEARAYSRMAEEFELKQEEIARKVGKSRASVANSMRLLDLAPQLQSYIEQGRLSVGHGKVLLGVKDHEEQELLATQVIRRGLSVRAAEKLLADHQKRSSRTVSTRTDRKSSGEPLPPALQEIENRLRHHLATHVALHHGGKKGRIEIEYYGNDDLERLMEVIGVERE